MKKALYILFFLSAILFIVGVYIENDLLRTITKPLPLVSLILLTTPNRRYSTMIFIGFIFSLAGDILLMKAVDLFLYGLIAFFVAHVFFIIGFVARYSHLKIASSIPFYLVAIGLGYFFYPYLGDMMLPVFAYIFIIMTMLWRSFLQRDSAKFSGMALLGAVFFVFSDFNIAFTKFYSDYEYSRIIIIATYWIAQFAIYYSTTQNQKKLL